jgi:hypothetical protein
MRWDIITHLVERLTWKGWHYPVSVQYGADESLVHCLCKSKMMQPIWETIWQFLITSKTNLDQVPVAHAWNPGWDWEDYSLRPAQENSLRDPITKLTKAKWTGGIAQVVAALQVWSPEFKLKLKLKINKLIEPGMVMHAYNPSF